MGKRKGNYGGLRVPFPPKTLKHNTIATAKSADNSCYTPYDTSILYSLEPPHSKYKMFSSAARTIVSRAAASSASSRGAVINRLNVQPSMMAARFASVSILFFIETRFATEAISLGLYQSRWSLVM